MQCEKSRHDKTCKALWNILPPWISTISLGSMAVPRLNMEPCVATARNGMDFGQPCGVTWNQATLESLEYSDIQWLCVTETWSWCNSVSTCVHFQWPAGGLWPPGLVLPHSGAHLPSCRALRAVRRRWALEKWSAHPPVTLFHKGKADDADANPIQIKRVKCPHDPPRILRMTKLQTLTQLWRIESWMLQGQPRHRYCCRYFWSGKPTVTKAQTLQILRNILYFKVFLCLQHVAAYYHIACDLPVITLMIL
jgi:hypothetical protein